MGMVRNYKPISMSHMGHMSHEDIDGGMVEFPKRWHPMALSKTPWQGTQFQIVNIMGIMITPEDIVGRNPLCSSMFPALLDAYSAAPYLVGGLNPSEKY